VFHQKRKYSTIIQPDKPADRFNLVRLSYARPDDNLRVMRKTLAGLIAVILLAGVAVAADISGTWNATVNLGDQTGSPTFVFKQDGEKLTGTYSGALGDAKLSGTVKGNEISFDFEAQGIAVNYSGKLSADGKRIEGTVDYGGQVSGTFTATKRETSKTFKNNQNTPHP
jgi:opacity protein-like surface antigen